jgi:predicted nucleic acid-binding protein
VIPTTAVFDASALVRAIVAGEPAALTWLESMASGELHAVVPDLVFFEFANALAVSVRAGDLPEEEAATSLDDLLELSLEVHSGRTLAAQARALASTRGISAYDAAYLALAVGYDAILVTADARLAAEAERSALLPDQALP